MTQEQREQKIECIIKMLQRMQDKDLDLMYRLAAQVK